jgi:site-specific recombinase XerD
VEWSRYNKSDYLLVNSIGNPVTPSKVTLWLNGIFGKQISSSMLRHIFLSDKFGGVNLQDLKSTAEQMGQKEISTTLKYVQKDAQQIISENEEK